VRAVIELTILAWSRWRYYLPLREERVCVSFFRIWFLLMANVPSYKLAAMKLVTPSKDHLEKHYEDLSEKPFFKGLVTCE
jgi:hypothetical protein